MEDIDEAGVRDGGGTESGTSTDGRAVPGPVARLHPRFHAALRPGSRLADRAARKADPASGLALRCLDAQRLRHALGSAAPKM